MTPVERFKENEAFLMSLRLEETADDDLKLYLEERYDLWSKLTPEEKKEFHRSK